MDIVSRSGRALRVRVREQVQDKGHRTSPLEWIVNSSLVNIICPGVCGCAYGDSGGGGARIMQDKYVVSLKLTARATACTWRWGCCH